MRFNQVDEKARLWPITTEVGFLILLAILVGIRSKAAEMVYWTGIAWTLREEPKTDGHLDR